MIVDRTIKLFLLMLTFGLLTGCGDSSTSSSSDTPPEPPSMDEIKMDISIFNIPHKMKGSEHLTKVKALMNEYADMSPQNDQTAYEYAGFFAMMADNMFQAAGIYPTIFFDMEMWGEPRVDGDTWIWEYSHSFEGESIAFLITAEMGSDSQLWQMRYSYSGSEGPNVDNALFIEADLNNDGNSGNWSIYELLDDENRPIINFEFMLQDGLTTYLDMDILFNEQIERFLYEVEDLNAIITQFLDDGPLTIIQWNRETGAGQIQSPDYNDGALTCWDEEFATIPC